MALKNSTTFGSPKLTIFLGEGTEVQLPNCTFNTGAAGAELTFGTISESVHFIRRPTPSEENLTVPRLPSKGRRPNVIVPATGEDVAVKESPRISAFERLSHSKRTVSMNDDDDEPTFTITTKGRESGIFHSSDEDTPKKNSVFSRLTQRKVKIPKQKLDFVSFQGHKNNQMGTFNNSFEPLKLVKKNATTADLRPQLNENRVGRPPRSYHKNSFSQDIYNTYAASKKLQSEKMRPKEFYQKKKQLISKARKTVFDRLTPTRNQLRISRSKFQWRREMKDEEMAHANEEVRSQPKISRSKFQWRREMKDEEMSDANVEIHTCRMVTEARGDTAPEQDQPGPVTRSRRRAADSLNGEEGSSHVPPHDGQGIGTSIPPLHMPRKHKEVNPPNEDDEDEPVFVPQKGHRDAEYKRLNDNMTMLMESMLQMQKQIKTLMEDRPEQPRPVEQRSRSPTPHPRETFRPVEHGGTSYIPVQEQSVVMTREEIQRMVVAELKQAKGSETRSDRDKPYPSYHDLVPYPKGYNVPKFKQFTGIGNPDQHLAHFVTACGDTSAKPSLLLRQFSASLAGVAFEWYANLLPESIQTWQQLKDAFRVRFGGISDKITIADLAATRQYKDEKVVDYIMRWRNLSIKCEQPLDQPQAVGLLLGNIDNWMAPFLSTSGITTFQDLISQAKKLERTNPKVLSNFQATSRNDKDKSKRIEGVKYTATTFNVEKRKGVAESHNPEQVKASVLGITGNESRPLPSLKDRMNKKYSFRRDKVHKIFKDAVREGLQLPECKRPEEQSKKDHPNYCPYHRVLGHTIEDCYVFKDWVERQYQEGKITLSKNVLSEQPAEHTHYVTTLDSEGSSQGEVIVKIINLQLFQKSYGRLAELPGISWKRSQEPPKGPPTKQSKKKNKKKKREQSKRKKSIIEEYIETLDEYEQKERVLITLKDYFPEEVNELLGELVKEIDEDVQVETCRLL
ncbi:Retrotransposon gag domain-containing protein [Dioscorea alata]|uniref:Retrotransposon gag domain-containing protein n=1 Tax=Dioscorea alata TaxID=55571 RepID=A0ACB7WM90_DIOAL|nr:Retrotransposon gag domain-containing protein [Dioscorea alata]